MRMLTFAALAAALMQPFIRAESESICIAPMSWKPLPLSAPGLYCNSEKVSLKIDAHVVPAPINRSVKISALDPTARHRVVVLCGGKPQQSFTFRFSQFKTNELCLFLDEAYKTAQLWEAKGCPWCKCK